MKYAVEICPRVTVYIASFIEIDSGIQKLIVGDRQTHRQKGYSISLL
jgi:hypothetical protein